MLLMRVLLTLLIVFQASTSSSPEENNQGGRCEPYRGGDTCLRHRTNEFVFVRGNTSQRVATELIAQSNVNNDVECIEALCYVLFPTCNDDTTGSVPICMGSCQAMRDRCGDRFTFRDGYVVYSASTRLRYDVTCRTSSTTIRVRRRCEFLFRDEIARRRRVRKSAPSRLAADTCGGNQPNGTPCVFPFTYFGVEYKECSAVALQYSGNRLWCATQGGSFVAHRKWIGCNCSDGYPVLRSKKEIYNGGDVCEPFRANASVFIDSRYNQTVTGEWMVDLERLAQSLPTVGANHSCYDDIMRFICFNVFPSPIQYEPNGSIFPAPICKRNCHYFLGARNPCYQKTHLVLFSVQQYFIAKQLNPMQVFLDLSSAFCSSLSEENCTDFQASALSTVAPMTKDFPTVVIIVGLLVPASVALIVTILCVLRYRKMKADVFNTLQRLSIATEPQLQSWKLSTSSDAELSLKEMLEQLKSSEYVLLEADLPNYVVDDIKYIKTLGEGTFGQVFLGAVIPRGTDDETLVAVKVLKNSSDDQVKKDFDAEMQIMKLLNHPNIVALLAKSESESAMGLVFEYMLYGDLNCFLRSSEPGEETLIRSEDKAEGTKHVLTLDNLTYMIMQICCALSYLAEYRFVHRDIATRNCLVGKGLTTKLADFGLAKGINSNYYRISKNRALLPIRWLSPESILYGKSSLKSDIWAFGILVWEVLTFGRRPYFGLSNAEVVDFIIGGGRPDLPDAESCPSFLKDVMQRCWLSDPAQRPTAAEILTLK